MFNHLFDLIEILFIVKLSFSFKQCKHEHTWSGHKNNLLDLISRFILSFVNKFRYCLKKMNVNC